MDPMGYITHKSFGNFGGSSQSCNLKKSPTETKSFAPDLLAIGHFRRRGSSSKRHFLRGYVSFLGSKSDVMETNTETFLVSAATAKKCCSWVAWANTYGINYHQLVPVLKFNNASIYETVPRRRIKSGDLDLKNFSGQGTHIALAAFTKENRTHGLAIRRLEVAPNSLMRLIFGKLTEPTIEVTCFWLAPKK